MWFSSLFALDSVVVTVGTEYAWIDGSMDVFRCMANSLLYILYLFEANYWGCSILGSIKI
jgi:hypothetical protein